MSLAVGTIVCWPGPRRTIPSGWMLCDGSSYQINDFPELAAVMQTSTKDMFTLPNFTGRGVNGATSDGQAENGGSGVVGVTLDAVSASIFVFGGSAQTAAGGHGHLSANITMHNVTTHFIVKAVS